MKHARVLLPLFFAVCCANLGIAQAKTDLPTHQIYVEMKSPRQVIARWGRYTVSVDRKDIWDGTVSITNAQGAVLRQVKCPTCYEVFTQQLDPSGLPDLLIVGSNGSNVWGAHTTFIFCQNGGLREVATITGGDGEFQHLYKHGLQYEMDGSGVLELACDYCHACSPMMTLVLEWNNGHPINKTAKYSWTARFDAAKAKADFLPACDALEDGDDPDRLYADAAEYYANEYELGQGREAYRWIMRHMPSKTTRQSFQLCARNIRRRIAMIPYMTTSSQAKVLRPPAESIFFVNKLD